jgi:hypothetical protein
MNEQSCLARAQFPTTPAPERFLHCLSAMAMRCVDEGLRDLHVPLLGVLAGPDDLGYVLAVAAVGTRPDL